MRRALELAERGTGSVSPNPRVGCVIVHENAVIAEGWHAVFGGPHAEVAALQAVGGTPPEGSVMYVTLEPCSHQGKTPPCVDAILASGIKHVVVAMVDPNPVVSGRGIATLRRSGVNVSVGILETEAAWMNRSFCKYVTTGQPYITLKLAQTIDGVIAPLPSRREQLTGTETARVVHQLRAESDAVMVGIQTVIIDDPQLTVRDRTGTDPIAIILDPFLDIPLDSHLVRKAEHRETLILCARGVQADRISALQDRKVNIIDVRASNELLDLQDVLTVLSERRITSILCEGGPTLASSLVSAGYIDELRLHIAPLTLGRGLRLNFKDGPYPFDLIQSTTTGQDVLLTYRSSRTYTFHP